MPLLSTLALIGLLELPAAAAPLTLYTMGPGDDLFTRYGHAALCVNQAGDTRCYSYGNTDFSSPVSVVWLFMRGQGIYWGEAEDEKKLLKTYKRRDQSIWKQEITLPPDQNERLARMLRDSVAATTRNYRYHHFYDNCSTRLRNPLDIVTGGLLSKDNDTADGPTYREIAERGLAGSLPLQIALELGLGREADHRTSPWQRMLLPEELRAQVERRLGARPVVVNTRKGNPPPTSTRAGRWAVALMGPLLAAPGLIRQGWLGKHRDKFIAFPLGLTALVFWSVAILTALSELRYNEALLCLCPLDLALPFLSEARRARWLQLRLAGLGAVAVLWLAGVLIQPLLPVLLFCALPLLMLWYKTQVSV